MSTTATDILAAKAAAGPDAYLWVHASGDVILWPSEAASVDDDGRNAIARWQVSPEVVDELIASASGSVDDVD